MSDVKMIGDLAKTAVKAGKTIAIEGRGMARRVSAAYKAFKEVGDQDTANMIANMFVSLRTGKHFWEK